MTHTLTVDGEIVQPVGPGKARVASATTPGHWYEIDLTGDPACDCRGYEVRHDCRHVRLVEKWDGKWSGAEAAPVAAGQLQLDGNGGDETVIPFSERTTKGGFKCGEVASALQKCIRRGLERDAIFWATELDQAGYGNYAWKRLRVICSEDVGLAWPEGPAVIESLRSAWVEFRKDEKGKTSIGNSILFLVHATALLARAPKSRIIDNAANVMYAGDRAAMQMTIPDFALDSHTAAGRRMGRSEKNHYDESYGLVDQVLDDPYEDEARAIDGAPPRQKVKAA